MLVVDDYHLITNQQIREALAHLIERSPVLFRLVLATRADPPLPLGKLRASGELVELRSSELRFSDDEAEAFLTDALGLELSTEEVAQLQARTEGWPAALYLAALSLRGRPDTSALIERFAGDDRYLVDYLTAEVLARQPPELRSFLLRTSILKRLCGPLCDAVTGRDASAALLAELEHSDLLLVPLDTRREWYRYHHLFGELLQYELVTTDREALPGLHQRASAWYRNAGLIVDAASHATDPQQFEQQVQLVCQTYLEARALYFQYHTHTISVDEMTGIQALERNAKKIPMAPGQPARIEFEYTPARDVMLDRELACGVGTNDHTDDPPDPYGRRFLLAHSSHGRYRSGRGLGLRFRQFEHAL